MCILKDLLVVGYFLSVGSEQADKYLVKYESIWMQASSSQVPQAVS